MIDHSKTYNDFLNQITHKWMNCSEDFPKNKKKFSSIEKFIWEMKCERFLNFARSYSEGEINENGILLNKCKSFFRDELSYTKDQLQLIFSDDMIEATKDFIRKALQFDSELGSEELFQALRNQWIVFGLQSLFGYPVQTTSSTLAYSLLYPYTDNFIDSRRISQLEKIEFSNRFESRLAGEEVIAISESEQKIYDLVAMIEQEYDRNRYPKVYESLLDIHHAQTKSIALTSAKQVLNELECFEIAVTKGATSVIADGYLIAGSLNMDQLQFLYEYGAYLQVLDDLQDARDDLYEGVFTCFSRNLHSQYLDRMLCKTYHLGKEVQATIEKIYPNEIAFQGLIKRSFGLLFGSCVVSNPKDFSPEFKALCEQHSPFKFSFAEKHKSELKGFSTLFERKLEEFKQEAIIEM
ncbi:hypothetical protein [Marinifilum caeruleilacunae]|uniref:Uncharacterized protein n=1 Tax=Marinifilum caeruleilacunae TaxID=2499076 RepID=A0ABX1X1C3_9BACT|nr:hypothetical protein [Marinifilum caeruleilacunae]NOU62170.1 hypothetical protein [Marinifilum caeruleilacunae]